MTLRPAVLLFLLFAGTALAADAPKGALVPRFWTSLEERGAIHFIETCYKERPESTLKQCVCVLWNTLQLEGPETPDPDGSLASRQARLYDECLWGAPVVDL